MWFSAAGDPDARQEAYGLIGAQRGMCVIDGRWRLTAFGRNLADENFVNNVIGQPVLGAPGVYSRFPSADARPILGVSPDLKIGGSSYSSNSKCSVGNGAALLSSSTWA